MSSVQEAAARAREKMQKENPSAAPGKTTAERVRVPLSVPQLKLEVPDIPGYYLRWFTGTPDRLAQAERAGFEFVSPEEVQLNNVSIGGAAGKDGNTDLGSRVSVANGDTIDGQAVRLYLMKQKMEYYLEDQELLNKRNDGIAEALTTAYNRGQVGGRDQGETAEDASLRYVDKRRSKLPDFFRKKRQ